MQASTDAHPPRSAPLDALRGLAVLGVIGYHYSLFAGTNDTLGRCLLWVGHQGWVGVDLFFVLSGYLITGILWDQKGARVVSYFGTFYARRTVRIFPLYYAVIASVLLIGTLIPALRTPGFARLVDLQPWLWFYGENFAHGLWKLGVFNTEWVDLSHFWTLAIEEQFYLVWPLVVWCSSRRSLMVFCVATVAASLAARAGWTPLGEPAANLLAAGIGSSGSLAIGGFVSMLKRGEGDWPGALRAAWMTFAVASAGFLAISLSGHVKESYVSVTWGILFLGLAFGALVFAVESGPSGRLFQSRTLRFFGTYSYGLYVYHWLLNPLFFAHLPRTMFRSYALSILTFQAGLFVATILVSLLSWHLFEKRVLSLKRFFQYQYPTEPVPHHTEPALVGNGSR